MARAKNRKLVLGYILRVHPVLDRSSSSSGQTLGKPLVMRLNLNQQSQRPDLDLAQEPDRQPDPDRRLRRALRRRDVPADRRQAGARARHRRHALGRGRQARTTATCTSTFDDGSVGWYEAGWGPMMSEVAFFVKDVVGPEGRGLDRAAAPKARTSRRRVGLRRHRPAHQDRRDPASTTPRSAPDKNFVKQGRDLHDGRTSPATRSCATASRPSSCKAIREDLDLSDSMDAAVNSLRIVLAAEQSINEKRVVELA